MVKTKRTRKPAGKLTYAPIGYIDRLCSRLEKPYTKKRKPSAYNNFVKQMWHTKKYSKLSPKSRMRRLAAHWKDKQGKGYIGGCKTGGFGRGTPAAALARLRAMLKKRM